jgi:tRNA(fMet)-specific endonuclease VapC
MYFLDTDTLTLAHAGHARITDQFRRVDPNEVAITVITRIEILQGRFAAVLKASHGEQLVRAQELLQRSEQRLQVLEVIPVDVAAAAEFDRLRQNKKLKKVGRGDLLIASIALAHRATLVSRNVKDFRQIPGLQVENWAD